MVTQSFIFTDIKTSSVFDEVLVNFGNHFGPFWEATSLQKQTNKNNEKTVKKIVGFWTAYATRSATNNDRPAAEAGPLELKLRELCMNFAFVV